MRCVSESTGANERTNVTRGRLTTARVSTLNYLSAVATLNVRSVVRLSSIYLRWNECC